MVAETMLLLDAKGEQGGEGTYASELGAGMWKAGNDGGACPRLRCGSIYSNILLEVLASSMN
jgi:hypothetical protein